MPNANTHGSGTIYTSGSTGSAGVTGHAAGYGGGGGIGQGGGPLGAAGISVPLNTASVQTYTSGSNYGYDTSTIKRTQSNSPDLPPMTIVTADEHGNQVLMTVAPEPHVSTGDCMKLLMLMFAVTVEPEAFNALAYVKKNNLERHFKYS